MPAALESLTKEDLHEAIRARHSFRSYTQFVHGWEPRPHQEIWWTALQALTDGNLLSGLWINGVAQTPLDDRVPTRKLMIVAPPASGKSDTANEFTGFTIGRATNMGRIPQFGIVAYGDEPAGDRSVAIRDNIQFNDAYRLVFPFAVPDLKKGWSGHKWFLQRDDPAKKDATLVAAGINGGILSYRFPTGILIDDPHDRRTIANQTQKDEVWLTWKSTIRTRAQEDTPIFLICTRWADDDLAGRLMDIEGDWCILRTTALQPEVDPEQEDMVEQHTYWEPERLPTGELVGASTEYLKNLKIQMGEDFLTQYMASPPSLIGDVFKWWHYGSKPVHQEVETIYQFWDTASNKTKRSAFSAMVEMWHLKNGRVYFNKVFREKMETPRLLKEVVRLFHEAATDHGEKRVVVLVEGKANGHAVAQILRSAIAIRALDIPQEDLMDRAKLISVYFQTGQVYLPNGWEPWKEPYEKEMRAAPRTQYLDQVAATVLGLEYIYPRAARGRPQPVEQIYWEN